MSRHVYDLPDLVIASSGTDSSAVAADPHYQRARAIIIQAPATLTGTITVQVSLDGGTTYADLQSGGADVTIAAASVAVIDFQGWTHLRVKSGSAEGAERTFIAKAVEEC